MYRQVVHDADDSLRLRIFFRFNENEPIAVFELLTLTYGLKPASYLATRALQQLAVDESLGNSPATAALKKDFYVDDYIGGAANVEGAIVLREDLTSLMAKGGFPIRKWCSNYSEVLAGIPKDQLGTHLTITFDLSPDEKVKILGITWEPKADQLRFLFNVHYNWLKAPPNTWKTFIANRVSTTTYGNPWKHVVGKENPADLVSRGVQVDDFLQSKLWKNGPSWLKESPSKWMTESSETTPTEVDLEPRLTTQANITSTKSNSIFSVRSTLLPLVRIVAWCFRFSSNCRKADQRETSAFLTVWEINKAKLALVRLVQEETFPEDIKSLKKTYQVSSKSFLKLLGPFVDKEVIRVGGRLRHSLEDYSVRHPAVLPQSHVFTHMLINFYHQKIHHGGHQATLAVMRQEFWPIHGKRAVTSTLRKCQRCFRFNPKPTQQPMGQLPSARVRPARPFLKTGIDYCGPFYLKPYHRRAAPPKTYIAVFVCFTTKAIHLELVMDLSTAGFISALRRFIGHHGRPHEIHSDNATNFQGAKNELHELYENLNSKQGQTTGSLEPNSHRRESRGTLSTQLTHENFCTLLVQIAAALNSRPLSPLSDDPTDINALTPAHFLIGTSMNAVPDTDLTAIPSNRLIHYQQRQQMFQWYWKRWSQEYLTGLQQVSKYLRPSPIRVGTLVVLREDNMPPLQWPLARITEIHPGDDGVVRVVTVRTAKGTYRRAVNRICPLPDDTVDTNEDC
ncbi:uncharacterized protein LOC134209076 [Armigeres subalbatus]|uniref:uncharacterized protein LOC134209076 n=1 Tax=Armigeres subalbatus TaxID=124917 RepID=UPI002ED4DE6B